MGYIEAGGPTNQKRHDPPPPKKKIQLNFAIFKVPISCVGILHICNLWILLRKIVIYLVGRKFYLRGLSVDGSDVTVVGICL